MPVTPSGRRTEVVVPTGMCWCGCGGETKPGKFFIQHHDATAYSCLRKVFRSDTDTNDGLANILATLGFDAGRKGVTGWARRVGSGR